MEAFELRLWDGRLGRWLTVDPMGQYFSPYLGMGNNPINGIDPDGGCFIQNEDGSYSPCPDGKDGDEKKGAFGYDWVYKANLGWELKNGGKGKATTGYIPVVADGTAEYYIKRYKLHIETYGTRPPDYYLGYGHKYINRFKKDTRPNLSIAGKKWLDKTAISLQLFMNKGLRASNGTIAFNNEKFKSFAFDSHVPAYVGSGLMDLGLQDKMTIGLTPDFGDLFSLDGLKQAASILQLQQIYWKYDIGNSSNNTSDCGCAK